MFWTAIAISTFISFPCVAWRWGGRFSIQIGFAVSAAMIMLVVIGSGHWDFEHPEYGRVGMGAGVGTGLAWSAVALYERRSGVSTIVAKAFVALVAVFAIGAAGVLLSIRY